MKCTSLSQRAFSLMTILSCSLLQEVAPCWCGGIPQRAGICGVVCFSAVSQQTHWICHRHPSEKVSTLSCFPVLVNSSHELIIHLSYLLNFSWMKTITWQWFCLLRNIGEWSYKLSTAEQNPNHFLKLSRLYSAKTMQLQLFILIFWFKQVDTRSAANLLSW